MNIKKNVLSTMVITLIIGLLFGGLIILLSQILNVAALIKWALIIAGIFTVIGNIPTLVIGLANVNKVRGIVDCIFSLIGIVLGFMMIFMQGTVMTFILAGYLIVFPILRIILAGKDNFAVQIRREWLKILVGVLLLFFPGAMEAADFIVRTVIFAVGCIIILLSLLSFIISLVACLTPSRKIKLNSDSMHIEVNAEDISDDE